MTDERDGARQLGLSLAGAVAVSGPGGCGKATLVQALCDEYEARHQMATCTVDCLQLISKRPETIRKDLTAALRAVRPGQ